jgi:hypothetical protein
MPPVSETICINQRVRNSILKVGTEENKAIKTLRSKLGGTGKTDGRE